MSASQYNSVSIPERRHELRPNIFVVLYGLQKKRTEQDPLATSPTPTILLIDDNAVQAATRQTILKRAGYFVIAVLNPQRALDQFRNHEFPEEIDLVITDHVMPGMSGSVFVRSLRESDPTLPVLVISGLEEAEAEYADMGVTFRLKPLLPDDLLASVHTLVNIRRPDAPNLARRDDQINS
jgi:DNA-binding response OmpR family regulator